MREPAEFGQVREGMRADLLLLDSNPLEDVVAFRQNRGVMARGFWLTRDKLDAALTTLAEVQSEAEPIGYSRIPKPGGHGVQAGSKFATFLPRRGGHRQNHRLAQFPPHLFHHAARARRRRERAAGALAPRRCTHNPQSVHAGSHCTEARGHRQGRPLGAS